VTRRIRIVIDDLDRGADPARPWTLILYRDEADGTPRRKPHRSPLVGASIPDMLRALADSWADSDEAELRALEHERAGIPEIGTARRRRKR